MKPTSILEHQLKESLQPVILGADFSCYAYIKGFWNAYNVKPIVLGTANIKAISSSRFCDYRVVPKLDDPEYFLQELTSLGAQ